MGDYVGQPHKLTPEFLAKARDYLENYEEYGDLIPSIAGLAVETGVGRTSLHKWGSGLFPENASEDVRTQYMNIFHAIGATQERKLMNGGLSNSMNPMICKLALGKHGYSEKVSQDNVSSDGSMSSRNNLTVTINRNKKS